MHIKASVQGAIFSFVILFILAICLSVYYHFGNMSYQMLNYLISFCIATAFLLGGFSSGYSAGEKGLINGIATALVAVLFVFIIVSLGADGQKDWIRFAINCGFAIFAGAVGGIIGVSKN